jgi:hypothetical protein
MVEPFHSQRMSHGNVRLGGPDQSHKPLGNAAKSNQPNLLAMVPTQSTVGGAGARPRLRFVSGVGVGWRPSRDAKPVRTHRCGTKAIQR